MKKFLIFALCAIAMFAGCNVQPEVKDENRVELVELTPLESTVVDRTLSFSTTLEGYQKMDIAPSISGRIEHIYTEVGTKVGAGTTLVRMDQNQYNTTKLTFTNLERELSRVESLVETGAVSQQVYDQTKLSYDQTKESLGFIEANTYVKAKFGGIISARNYEDGELYAGQAILTLTQINVLKAFINIPETYFPLIKKGMKINVISDIYPDELFPATIDLVYPTIDATSHSFKVRVRIPNGAERLRPGIYASTSVAMGEVQATIVPYQSVQKLTGSNERFIYVNNNGVAKRVFVKVGERYDDKVEIISDELALGDEIVTTGAEKLVDGAAIKTE